MEGFCVIWIVLSVPAHRFRFFGDGWAEGALREILLKVLLFLRYSLFLLLLQPT